MSTPPCPFRIYISPYYKISGNERGASRENANRMFMNGRGEIPR
jgi:hypothetical protein